MNRYRQDPGYFLAYFVANIAVFGALVALLAVVGPVAPLALTWPVLALIPLGVIFGLVVSTAFHNASHQNIKPRWLNTVVGELAGAYTLEGMRNFRVGHMLHHRHTDDPALDPHPPAGQTFWRFLVTSKARTIACLTTLYLQSHGDTPASRRNVRWQLAAFHLSSALKLVFWLLLLGPVIFGAFFVPSFLAYVLGFGHLNWISHLDDSDGTVRIKNLNGSAYYRVMNLITSGGYHHANHHRQPWLYNPSKAASSAPRAVTSATTRSTPDGRRRQRAGS
jgi:fatty acid desaturase